MHFVRKQPEIVWLIYKPFKEVSSTGTEGAIRISFQCPNSKIRAPKSAPYSDFHLIIHLRDQWRDVDAGGQLSPIEQLGVGCNIFVIRIHVLHAGHAQGRRMGQRTLHRFQALLVREGRNHLVHQFHGRVLERARRIAVRIPHDHAAGWLRGLRRDPGQPQRSRICQRHVAVVPAQEHWRVPGDWINQFFSGQLRRRPFGFVPVATKHPFAFRRLFGAFTNPAYEFFFTGHVIKLHLL